jgi:hypothetical protein
MVVDRQGDEQGCVQQGGRQGDRRVMAAIGGIGVEIPRELAQEKAFS